MTRRLDDFFGRYSLAREIYDRRAGQVLRFTGFAEITPTDAGALYIETGEMVMPEGQVFQAQRRYLWAARGDKVQVSFDDGRAFHDFDPQQGGAATEHLCGEDMYRGGYEFSDWPHWSLTWSVSGPRKDYRSQSFFIPVR
jgi:hypothetical protein